MLPLASRGRFTNGLLALGLIVAGACASDEADFGPLAVVDDPAPTMALMAFGGSGPVDIGERCVAITTANGTVVPLVWRSGEITWDEEDRAITFSSPGTGKPTPVTMRDGDVIAVGGAALAVRESAPGKIRWLAEPDDSCKGKWWSVHGVSLGSMPTR